MEEDIANHQAQQEAEAIAARQAQEKMRHQLTNQVEEIYRARYTMHQEVCQISRECSTPSIKVLRCQARPILD